MKVGRLTVSDRAHRGIYEDRSGPVIERLLGELFGAGTEFLAAIVPDERDRIASQLIDFADRQQCDLVVTTGGTGISDRDVTPEATADVLEKHLPGFGEIMRTQSFAMVRTAILSRAIAGVRGSTLIINLPGKPTAVIECLQLLAPAIREGIGHLQGDDPHQEGA